VCQKQIFSFQSNEGEREDGDLYGSVVVLLILNEKKLFLNRVSVVHFTPCFWARSEVFPLIRPWIPIPVRRCLGFCRCFIHWLRSLVSEVLVFLWSDRMFSSVECAWPRRRVPSLSRLGLGPCRRIFLSPKISAFAAALRLASCVARSGV
jgi:hypothetical protein